MFPGAPETSIFLDYELHVLYNAWTPSCQLSPSPFSPYPVTQLVAYPPRGSTLRRGQLAWGICQKNTYFICLAGFSWEITRKDSNEGWAMSQGSRLGRLHKPCRSQAESLLIETIKLLSIYFYSFSLVSSIILQAVKPLHFLFTRC